MKDLYSSTFHNVPKIIWIYWDTGFESAPYLVKKCVESWQKYNPDWKVQLLDATNLHQFIDSTHFPTVTNFKIQWGSDLYRLELLSRYGGVWADATTFCTKPLDSWLSTHLTQHFFAFDSQKTDRWVQSWFIATAPDSPFIKLWRDAFFNYLQNNNFRKIGYFSRQIIRKLMSLRKRNIVDNTVWFSQWLTKGLRIHPYPMVMYVFEHALHAAPTLKHTWLNSNRLKDADAEFVQLTLGINTPLSEAGQRFIDQNKAPLYKLNWRQDPGEGQEQTHFGYIIQQHLGAF